MSGTDYFTYATLTAGTLARASDVNSRMAAVQGGFGLLPHYSKIAQGRVTYAADTGVANALVASLDPAPTSYSAGLEVTVKIAVTNTGASTLNVNGLGAKTILRPNGAAVGAGDLTAGYVLKMAYDGTNFRMIGVSETTVASYVTAAGTSATNAAASATAAAASATAAAASASAAATSATNAASSATAAAASAASAAAAVSGYAALAGAAFTGAVSFAAAVTIQAPSGPTNPATKAYVDAAVFAAGSVSADEVTIHSAAGVFALKAIANNTVIGNVSGGSAVPGALTATQLTALLNGATGSLQGAMSAADKTKLDAITGTHTGTNTGDQTTVSGNAGTATVLQTARTIGISGAVTGTPTSFDGSANITIPITALDMASATTGTLAVARGGTGTTAATGTGSLVLDTAPTLSNPVVGTQASSDNSTKAASTAFVQTAVNTAAPAFLSVTSISANRTLSNTDNNSIIFCTGATGRTITANSTPTTGFSCILAYTTTVAWTFSCAGGVYTDGATATVTSVSIPAGSRTTAIHKGAGVWLLTGV